MAAAARAFVDSFAAGGSLGRGVWAAAGGGATFLLYKGYIFAAWYREQTARVTQPSSQLLESSVEVLREPCEVFTGKDVVVRYHQYRTVGSSAAGTHTRPTPSPFGRLFSLFNVVGQDEPGKGLWYESRGAVDDLSQYRRVEGSVEPRAGAIPSVPWPAGTSRYATLTIEPSKGARRAGLQGMLDASTDQSLVRCLDSHRHQLRASDGSQGCQQDTSTILAPYLRTMLVPFCLFPFPSSGGMKVCQLGGGGGALPAFIQQYFGAFVSRLDVVEIEPAVMRGAITALGFQYAGSANSRRVGAAPNVIIDDGMAFLQRTVDGYATGADPVEGLPPCRYDVLLVDMFDGARLPDFMRSNPEAFLRQCNGVLSDRGVVAINLPQRDPEVEAGMRAVFGKDNTLAIPCPRPNSNCILLGARGGFRAQDANGNRGPAMERRHFAKRCHALSESLGLPFDASVSLPLWWWM